MAQGERHVLNLGERFMSAQITQIGTRLIFLSSDLAQVVLETPPSQPAPAASPALPAPLPREPHIPEPEHNGGGLGALRA